MSVNSNQPQQPSTLSQGIDTGGSVMRGMLQNTNNHSLMSGDFGISKIAGGNMPSWMGSAGNFAGKALPALGVADGLYGMFKNRSALGNVFSGTKAGAGIGSMIMPGLGTAVGAGLGALAGGVEDLFRIGKPSAQEVEGRGANSDIMSGLGRMATPQEIQEAQSAVKSGSFSDTTLPLSLIVTRNKLIQSGMDPKQAVDQSNAWIDSIDKAEKGGGAGVQSAFQPIGQFLQSHGYIPKQAAAPAPVQQPPQHNQRFQL